LFKELERGGHVRLFHETKMNLHPPDARLDFLHFDALCQRR